MITEEYIKTSGELRELAVSLKKAISKDWFTWKELFAASKRVLNEKLNKMNWDDFLRLNDTFNRYCFLTARQKGNNMEFSFIFRKSEKLAVCKAAIAMGNDLLKDSEEQQKRIKELRDFQEEIKPYIEEFDSELVL
jgi:hypothetical protein